MDRIDFRSDTVTWPTPEMREAMANCAVGDDVMGEDPTVRRLEEMAASRVGKEAGLFVTSGTQGNLVAIIAHAGRGDEAILGYHSHVFQWEAGGMASLAGVMPHPLETDAAGMMDVEEVRAAIRADDPHLPRTRLILVENSFGGHGGVAIEPDYFDRLRSVAEEHGLAMHLDGARLFNAAVALDVDARELCRSVDSVTFCLSKGLCAPVGSVLCGSREFIGEARRVRKRLGGGMRQAGVLAAAGIVALEKMIGRLGEDHSNARRLAEGLRAIPGVRVDPRVDTNIVFFHLAPDVVITPDELCRLLNDEYRIALSTYSHGVLRAITHYWVGPGEVDQLLVAVRDLLEAT